MGNARGDSVSAIRSEFILVGLHPMVGCRRNREGSPMNTLEIKGDWNIIKGKLKQKWAQLTDDDLQYIEGNRDELLGRIQKRTGETREAVETLLKEYTAS